jgi:hypothetical protein
MVQPVGNGSPNVLWQEETRGFDAALATQRDRQNENADGKGGRAYGTQVAQVAIAIGPGMVPIPPNRVYTPGSPANQQWLQDTIHGWQGLINHIRRPRDATDSNAKPPGKADAANPADASAPKKWPPRKTISGKIVPVGTLAYRPLDIPPPGQTQHGVAGPHYNMYRANQNPNNGQCFWQPVAAIPAADLPSNAIHYR